MMGKDDVMKMYILIKKSVPLGLAVNAAAHASLMCYLKYEDTEEMQIWLKESFKKVTCSVSDEEFEEARKLADHALVTESALDGAEIALGFKPMQYHPEEFFKYKLLK